MESQTLFINLIKQQRKLIPMIGNYGKLSFDDIKRLDKYIDNDIFNKDNDECIIYKGELKKNYATISFKSRKVSVHRLLYHNYIDNITEHDQILFNCKNKSTCCNLMHFNIITKTRKE